MSERHKMQDASGVVAETATGEAIIVAGTDLSVHEGKAGYAVGCLFIHTDGAAGSALYVNEGTSTTSNFDEVGTI
jgi:hypothetical protein